MFYYLLPSQRIDGLHPSIQLSVIIEELYTIRAYDIAKAETIEIISFEQAVTEIDIGHRRDIYR